jgi:hypothetical protein
MDISKISTSVLESLIKLTKKREALLEELKSVEAKLTAAYSGGKAPKAAKVGKVAKSPGRRGRKSKAAAKPSAASAPSAKSAAKGLGRRGALKAKIIAALRAAGDKGIAVKDLSKKIGVKNQNVHVWFSSTGKKLGVIQRVGTGAYRLKPGA